MRFFNKHYGFIIDYNGMILADLKELNLKHQSYE